jgi:hypothetical protein
LAFALSSKITKSLATSCAICRCDALDMSMLAQLSKLSMRGEF